MLGSTAMQQQSPQRLLQPQHLKATTTTHTNSRSSTTCCSWCRITPQLSLEQHPLIDTQAHHMQQQQQQQQQCLLQPGIMRCLCHCMAQTHLQQQPLQALSDHCLQHSSCSTSRL
jgi:hypothetical protein